MKTVTIAVRGGVAEVVHLPGDVTVIVRDYDIEGTDEADLSKDKDGEDYMVRIYTHEN